MSLPDPTIHRRATPRAGLASLPKLLPGLVLAVGLALVAYLLTLMPGLKLVSTLLLAIVLGIAARNMGLLPQTAQAGLTFASKSLLRLGVVLLGLRLSLPDVFSLGFGALLTILLTVAGTYLVAIILRRYLALAPTTALLTTTGTAICGASAIAGISAALPPKAQDPDDETVDNAALTALAVITLCGTLTMFALPALVGFLPLTPLQAGVWLGASIHEVGQVVAAGGFISPEVTDIATVSKLGRVVLLAPIVALVGYGQSRQAQRKTSQAKSHRPPLLPLFVVGFIVAIVLRSVLAWSSLDQPLGPLLAGLNTFTTFILAVAMAALGTAVNLKSTLSAGGPALLFGLILSGATASIALGLTLCLV